ncbi:uncharacterized protein LOC144446032 [Glandiceps talaboti]
MAEHGRECCSCCIGVDVGGTNTDAVVLRGGDVVSSSKTPTTEDVTSGVSTAIANALRDASKVQGFQGDVSRVNIGTTHFVNAVIQRRNLAKVSVLRLCGPASTSLPPFCDFPEDLIQAICESTHFLQGGYQFDGRESTSVDEDQVRQCINQIKSKGVSNVVVSGIFSPVNPAQELQVAEILNKEYPDISFTLSHKVGELGLLERENAAILNESLKPLCIKTISAFENALKTLGLNCPLYLTQNDGTVLSAQQTLDLPVHTFSSGPTNSMRGAAHLSGVKDAIVIDIGGTTTDVGSLKDGFPRQASTHVEVGNVRTNFRMPDVLSIGLGGGSHVCRQSTAEEVSGIQVGPLSCGYKLTTESLVFGETTGNKVLTATDIAVAAGLINLGDPTRVDHLDEEMVKSAIDEIHKMVECAIDQVKISEEDEAVILVGGGSILIDDERKLKGTSRVIKPPFYGVANAVGAALSQVSGQYDDVVNMDEVMETMVTEDATEEEKKEARERGRQQVIETAKKKAIQDAVNAGADESTVKIMDLEEVTVTYLIGNAVRYKVKAVGSLKLTDGKSVPGAIDQSKAQEMNTTSGGIDQSETQNIGKTVTGVSKEENVTCKGASKLQPKDEECVKENEPYIDEDTGEWWLSCYDLDCIAVGGGILGCGGGGNPHVGKIKTQLQLRAGKKVRVITPDRLQDDGQVVMIAYMGAPLVIIEKLCNSVETMEGVFCLQDIATDGFKNGDIKNKDGVEIKQGKGVKYVDNYPVRRNKDIDPATLVRQSDCKISGLMSAEVGGLNSVEPLYVAALLDLPVVDADGMGRAFPELQMFSPAMYGKEFFPTCLVDENGKRAVILQSDSPKDVENHFRQVVIQMGCKGGLTLGLTKEEIDTKTVWYSLSRAYRLGHAVLCARKNKTNPIQTILQHENGKLLFNGKMSDVSRATEGGFNRGKLTVEGFGDYVNQRLMVDFQNENLIATLVDADGNTKVVATVPDLISVVDFDSGEPIPTDEVKYGLRVAVLAIASPPLLRTQRALEVVGPQAFGYSVPFTPIADYQLHDPIPRK